MMERTKVDKVMLAHPMVRIFIHPSLSLQYAIHRPYSPEISPVCYPLEVSIFTIMRRRSIAGRCSKPYKLHQPQEGNPPRQARGRISQDFLELFPPPNSWNSSYFGEVGVCDWLKRNGFLFLSFSPPPSSEKKNQKKETVMVRDPLVFPPFLISRHYWFWFWFWFWFAEDFLSLIERFFFSFLFFFFFLLHVVGFGKVSMEY